MVNHMFDEFNNHDQPIFSYVIASADMRYIELGKRNVYLRKSPKRGWVFRGEIPDCGADCFIDLSEIFLEYAMSCEGCRDDSEASEEAIRLGKHLGEKLVSSLSPDTSIFSTLEVLSSQFKIILNSMHSVYTEDAKANFLEYSLDCCPLRECAQSTGFGRNVEIAHLSVVALCKSLVDKLAPEWQLIQPSEQEADLPIRKITISGL
jgi:hypothetical protein